MADPIELKKLRIDLNDRYVGFYPNGDSIKPIHIAGGVFRVVYGATLDFKKIKMFGFVVGKKGKYPNDPKGTSPDVDEQVVRKLIKELNCFDEDPDKDSLKSMRVMLQKLLGTDDGLFPDNSQLTFSAGSKYFIKGKAQYEDAGEFIGGVIKDYCPVLADYIKGVLKEAQDPISVLMTPMQDDTETSEINDADLRHKGIDAFINQNDAMRWYLEGVRESGECLKANLERMPNTLTQLRIFNFFCIFHLVRYMSLLESFYCGGKTRPFLLDFSDNPRSGIASASTTSYARVHQSVSRFYSWAFGEMLREQGYTKEELVTTPAPIYDKKNASKDQGELENQWNLAIETSKDLEYDETLMEFGRTLYNMSSMESSGYPVTFLRILGAQAGIVFPTQRDSKKKRFKLSQDTLEMVVRSCVRSDDTITYAQLCERLWNRFNIVISRAPDGTTGTPQTEIAEGGLDSDVLEENHQKCVHVLEAMDFADLMADGILRVHLGGAN